MSVSLTPSVRSSCGSACEKVGFVWSCFSSWSMLLPPLKLRNASASAGTPSISFDS